MIKNSFYYNSKLNAKNTLDENIELEKKALYQYLNNELKIDYRDSIQKYKDNKVNYYDPIIDLFFKEEQLAGLFSLAKSIGFTFESLISAKIFYEKYCLWSDDRHFVLETPEERITILAAYLSNGDYDFAAELITMICNKAIVPSTTIYQGAGLRKGKTLSSCFMFNSKDDLNGLSEIMSKVIPLSTTGSGISIDVSNIRGRGEPVGGVKGQSHGVLPIMKIIEQTNNFINRMDQRKSATAFWLDIFHPDIYEFLDSKKINSDENFRLKLSALGVKIPNIFFEKTKLNEDIPLFKVKAIKDKYGFDFSEIDWEKHYHKLANDGSLIKEYVNPRKLLNRISSLSIESGYPYILFSTNANNGNTNKNLGRITMSNLCTEYLEPKIETPFGKVSNSCSVSSINIDYLESNNEYESVIQTITKMLENANKLNEVPSTKYLNSQLVGRNSIIIGITNLATHLANNKLKFKNSLDYISCLLEKVNYYSLKCSLANETDLIYDGFEESSYSTGEYFKKYLSKEKNENNLNWSYLSEEVKKRGLRIPYRLALPPNQSSSYVVGHSSSFMPLNSFIEKRKIADLELNFMNPSINNENKNYIEYREQLDNKTMISIVARMQKHIDQSIAYTPFNYLDTSTKDVSKDIINAWRSGLKTIYYSRTLNKKLN